MGSRSSLVDLLMTIALSFGGKVEMAEGTQNVIVFSLGKLSVQLVRILRLSLILRNGMKVRRNRNFGIRAENRNYRNRVVVSRVPSHFIQLDFLH